MGSPRLKPVENTAPVSFETNSNTIQFEYENIEEAFPAVAPGREPFGHNILVQIRQPKLYTKGGIRLPDNARGTEYYNTRVAKVIALGPLCFTSTHTLERNGNFESRLVEWPEGRWFEIGDFVEIPQYGGQRFVVEMKVVRRFVVNGCPETETVTESVTFAMFKAKDIIAKITCDPRSIRAYTD